MIRTIQRASVVISLLLAAVVPASVSAQTAAADKVFGYPGAGVLQAGDLWESFLPENSTLGYYNEVAAAPTLGRRMFLRMGNYEKQWSVPNSSWPAAYPIQTYWEKEMLVTVHDTLSTFNPAQIDSAANPSYFAGDKAVEGPYSKYAWLSYKPTVVGASDPLRNYTRDPYFTDAGRQHVVYEAAWPTNVGIDVKFRAHSFAAPNWANLNDFVIMEVTLTNTGVLDMDMNGKPEKTNNRIPAFAFWMGAQSIMSTNTYKTGLRYGGPSYTITPIGRQTAYIADPDSAGNPWDFVTTFASATTKNPPAGQGQVDIGFNNWGDKNYTDTWYGWVMLDVKKGAMPADVTTSVAQLDSKQTIFGTHPIGVGPRRGWYEGAMAMKPGFALASPRDMFTTCIAEWYTNGGRSIQNGRGSLDLHPNPKFFASGTADNIFTFVPKTTGAEQPDGDSKSAGVFDQMPFEDGSADATTNYPKGYGKFSKGASHSENFDGEMYTSVGPFSLDVGESVTIVLATTAGYRLEGIQRAVDAARWAFGRNLDVPKTPALPKLFTRTTPNKSVLLEWDNAAEADPQFAGYKIWKSSQVKKKSFLDQGMRIVDRYQEQTDPGPIPSSLKKPVNPKFDAFAAVNATALQGIYQPDTWGTWDLVRTIPKAELSSFTTASNPGTSTTMGYAYKYDDKETIFGFTYWYYVSAYKDVPAGIAGPGGQTTTRIETHSTNRNGASGLWNLTYPFATANANYPAASNTAAYQAMGGPQTVFSALAPGSSVANVGVRPNPYKRAALHDNLALPFDHKLLFYNLPSPAKITIVDVAGQIIDVINFSSSNQTVGSVFWDMFSKDGIEAASGVYIYIVESGTDKMVGHFAILR